MSLLALKDVGKRFANGTEALSGLNFEITEAEFVSLLGPSGCGKSTALRLIAELIAPDSGAIDWNGPRPEMGFVFQEPTLMPWTDALSNARLPLDLKGVERQVANDRAMRALTRMGLKDFARAFPRELSGGMKMRVSIARALSAEPRLLLMDEPFAALDEPTRQALNDDLKRLSREDRITVIFVTHSVTEASYLSDRVLVMTPRPGRIKAEVTSPPAQRGAGFRASSEFATIQARVAKALLEAA